MERQYPELMDTVYIIAIILVFLWFLVVTFLGEKEDLGIRIMGWVVTLGLPFFGGYMLGFFISKISQSFGLNLDMELTSFIIGLCLLPVMVNTVRKTFHKKP